MTWRTGSVSAEFEFIDDITKKLKNTQIIIRRNAMGTCLKKKTGQWRLFMFYIEGKL